MKHIVREGKVCGEGHYWAVLGSVSAKGITSETFGWFPTHPVTYTNRSEALGVASRNGGRVVTPFSHEEAKRKAAAEALRDAAACAPIIARGYAVDLEERADALWPRKSSGR